MRWARNDFDCIVLDCFFDMVMFDGDMLGFVYVLRTVEILDTALIVFVDNCGRFLAISKISSEEEIEITRSKKTKV